MNSLEYQVSWDDIGQDIPLEAIALDDAQLAQATRWSQLGMGAAQQWQIYRNSLALIGFQQWLTDRGIQAPLNIAQNTLKASVTANLLDAIAHVTVGSTQVALCIRPFDHIQSISSLLCHHQPFWADLYLWIDLWEETGHVAIASGLWHQDLNPVAPSPSDSWQMDLPPSPSWLDPEQILLALRRPQSQEIPRAIIESPMVSSAPLTQSRLEGKLQHWTESSLCSEVLEVQEALQILRSPELSHCFEQTLEQKFHPTWLSSINVGQWWSEVVDTVQAEMGWQPLPMMAMRSPSSGNNEILGRLVQQGIQIPAHARASYQDVSFAAQALRLYAVAWPNTPLEESWSLLIALCPVPSSDLSLPIQFEIRDANESLAQEQLIPKDINACRYIQVTGGLDEQFRVTLTHVQQPEITKTLPSFKFVPVDSN